MASARLPSPLDSCNEIDEEFPEFEGIEIQEVDLQSTDPPCLQEPLPALPTTVHLADETKPPKVKPRTGYSFVDVSNNRRLTLDLSGLGPDQLRLLETMDTDGDGHLTMSEVMASLTQNAKKTRQLYQMKRFLALVVFVALLLVVALFTTTLFAVEISKESHIQGSLMVDKAGHAVSTANADMTVVDGQLVGRPAEGTNVSAAVQVTEVSSFATLFDLPSFDARTLTEVKTLTLTLPDRSELSLSVTGALRRGGSRTVTFFTHTGDVTVDGATMTAVLSLQGRTVVLEAPARRARRLQGRLEAPRMYSEREFFTPANGFEVSRLGRSRRLQADADQAGYANFALRAADAMLEFFAEDQDQDYQTILVTGFLHTCEGASACPGTARGYSCCAAAKETVVPVEIFKNVSGSGDKVRLVLPDGSQQLMDHALKYSYEYSPAGDLATCEFQGSKSNTGGDDASAASNVVVGDGGMLVTHTAEDGDKYLLRVEGYELDAEVTPALAGPGPDECAEVVLANRAKKEAESRRLEAARSQLPSHNESRQLLSESDFETLWLLSWAGYYDQYAPGGWSIYHTCEVDNAYARILTPNNGGDAVVAFSGTNPTSLKDWMNNIDIGKTTVGGKQVHRGFARYMEKVAPCVEQQRQRLAASGRSLKFALGHSLGGAAATLYYRAYNRPTTHGVVTFGAPKVRFDATGCGDTVPGKRFAHDDDPVASNIRVLDLSWLGLPSLSLDDFDHDVEEAITVETKCTKWKGWFWKKCTRWAHVQTKLGQSQCFQPSDWNIWTAIQNFASVHLGYFEYTS